MEENRKIPCSKPVQPVVVGEVPDSTAFLSVLLDDDDVEAPAHAPATAAVAASVQVVHAGNPAYETLGLCT